MIFTAWVINKPQAKCCVAAIFVRITHTAPYSFRVVLPVIFGGSCVSTEICGVISRFTTGTIMS